MKQEPGKQMVSQGAYVAKAGSKAALALLGSAVFLMGLLCMVFLWTVLLPFLMQDLPWWEACFAITFIGTLSCGPLALLYFGKKIVKEAKETETGILLTRANTADLPASDSLVRASSEPLQAQENVLLRAAMETTEKQENELLRASSGGQE